MNKRACDQFVDLLDHRAKEVEMASATAISYQKNLLCSEVVDEILDLVECVVTTRAYMEISSEHAYDSNLVPDFPSVWVDFKRLFVRGHKMQSVSRDQRTYF